MAKGAEHTKEALGGLGTLIGAIGGGFGAPKGKKTEGLGRGVGQGLGWDVGGGAGSMLGGVAGPAIMAAIAKAQGRELSPEEMLGAASLGAVGGYGLGGLGGRQVAKGMMGDPSWKSKEQDDLRQEAALA